MIMKEKERGFTLIELMIVIAIIGILAAIAIPQFASYRVKAYNSSAESDLNTARTVYETFFNDNAVYPKAVNPATGKITIKNGNAKATFTTSDKVYFGSKVGANDQSYGAATKHTAGDVIYQTTSDAPTITQKTGTKGKKLASGDVPKAP